MEHTGRRSGGGAGGSILGLGLRHCFSTVDSISGMLSTETALSSLGLAQFKFLPIHGSPSCNRRRAHVETPEQNFDR